MKRIIITDRENAIRKGQVYCWNPKNVNTLFLLEKSCTYRILNDEIVKEHITGIKEEFLKAMREADEVVIDMTNEYFLKYAPVELEVEIRDKDEYLEPDYDDIYELNEIINDLCETYESFDDIEEKCKKEEYKIDVPISEGEAEYDDLYFQRMLDNLTYIHKDTCYRIYYIINMLGAALAEFTGKIFILYRAGIAYSIDKCEDIEIVKELSEDLYWYEKCNGLERNILDNLVTNEELLNKLINGSVYKNYKEFIEDQNKRKEDSFYESPYLNEDKFGANIEVKEVEIGRSDKYNNKNIKDKFNMFCGIIDNKCDYGISIVKDQSSNDRIRFLQYKLIDRKCILKSFVIDRRQESNLVNQIIVINDDAIDVELADKKIDKIFNIMNKSTKKLHNYYENNMLFRSKYISILHREVNWKEKLSIIKDCILITIPLLFIALVFILPEWKYNIPAILVNFVESSLKESQKNMVYYVFPIIFIPLQKALPRLKDTIYYKPSDKEIYFEKEVVDMVEDTNIFNDEEDLPF